MGPRASRMTARPMPKAGQRGKFGGAGNWTTQREVKIADASARHDQGGAMAQPPRRPLNHEPPLPVPTRLTSPTPPSPVLNRHHLRPRPALCANASASGFAWWRVGDQMSRAPPRRNWRSDGTEPLPSGAEAMGEPFAAFPSWFMRVSCERCGQDEVHSAQRAMLIRDIIEKMRHERCGGRAGKAELLSGVEGVSSRPVREGPTAIFCWLPHTSWPSYRNFRNPSSSRRQEFPLVLRIISGNTVPACCWLSALWLGRISWPRRKNIRAPVG